MCVGRETAALYAVKLGKRKCGGKASVATTDSSLSALPRTSALCWRTSYVILSGRTESTLTQGTLESRSERTAFSVFSLVALSRLPFLPPLSFGSAKLRRVSVRFTGSTELVFVRAVN